MTLVIMTVSVACHAYEIPEEPKKKSNLLFEVETTEADASASLNRIAGEIDMGFEGPTKDTFYKSPNHYGASPTDYEKAKRESL